MPNISKYKNPANLSSKFTAKRVASGLAIILIIWIISGILLPGGQEKPESGFVATQLIPSVNITNSNAQDIRHNIVLYGVTENLKKAEIATKVDGKVVEIVAEEGSDIKAGDIILKLDIQDRMSKMEMTKALVEQRELEYKVAKSLKISGHQSKTKLAQSYTMLKEAQSNLLSIQLDIANTTIKAPFDGILEKIHVELGDYVSEKSEIMATVIDNNKYIVSVEVPETKINEVQKQGDAYIKILDNHEITGKIKYISKIADNITRTFKVEILIPNNDNNISSGMTAEVKIPTKQIRAHLIPSSVLSLDEDGTIGVKIIEDGNKVLFKEVDIVDSDNDGLWVTGMPDSVKLITLGQAFVKSGDTVKTAESSEN